MSSTPHQPGADTRLQSLKAIGLLLAAILCFDGMSVFVRILSERYSPLELSAYRNVLGVWPSLLLIFWTGELRLSDRSLIIDKWGLALGRGLVVAIAQLCFYSAIARMELATISALAQTNAFFVVLLSILILGERVGPWRWGALVLGFAGAMLILQPGSDAFSLYALLPITAALCYGLSMVTVRLFDDSVSNAMLYLYSSCASGLGAIALAAVTTSFTPLASLTDALAIFLMSTAGGFGVLLIMLAYRMAAPSLLAPFGFFGLLSAFGFGWLFFGEAPLDTLFPGALLIVGAGLLIMWRENR